MQNKQTQPGTETPMQTTRLISEYSIVRYSDEELNEFKELITEKLNRSRSEYQMLKEVLSHNSGNGINDTLPAFNLIEDASDALAKEEMSNQAMRLLKYIEHLQNALVRIQNKTYGICSVTGVLISKERLRSVPHSTLSIDAKMGARK
jgi:DnaK suppressor protein